MKPATRSPKAFLALAMVFMLTALMPAYAQGAYYNAEGYRICDETIAVTISGSNAGTADWQNTLMVQEIESRFGIHLNCVTYGGDDFSTQVTLMFASDELPDILAGGLSMNDVSRYASEGYLLALSDHATLMPNLYGLFEQYPDYKSYLTDSDGKIYTVTKLNTNALDIVNRSWINNNWLKNVGMEAPATVDEFYDMLKAFKEQDANGNGDPNDEIPWGFGPGAKASEYSEKTILSAFDIQGGKNETSRYILAVNDGKVEFELVTEKYKAYLQFIRKLYEEALIDPAAFVLSSAEYNERVKNDQYGYFHAAAPYAVSGNDISYDANFTWLGGLTSEWNAGKTIPQSSAVSASPKYVVNANTQYPEAICRLIDYFYSEEGQIAGSRGWEGVSFDWVEDPDLEGSIATQYVPEGYTSTEDFRIKKATINGLFQNVSTIYGSQYDLIMNASDEVLARDSVLKAWGWAVLIERGRRIEGMELIDVFPLLNYTLGEANARSSLFTDITNYIATVKAQFIIGDLDLGKDWDNYLAELEKMGLQELLAIEQAAYDRTVK